MMFCIGFCVGAILAWAVVALAVGQLARGIEEEERRDTLRVLREEIMTGPFKPEDFENVDGGDIYQGIMVEISTVANAIDAKRWECPKGGEHAPKASGYWNFQIQQDDVNCKKCGAKLRARWGSV